MVVPSNELLSEGGEGLQRRPMAPPVTPESSRELVESKAKSARERVAEEALTPEQERVVKALEAAKGSEERVKLFATFMDDLGIDPLISLIPVLGDSASSIISGIYLLFEAKHADLGAGAYVRIVGLQGADLAAGLIEGVGDFTDLFFKANKWSEKSFVEQTAELVKKAREAGVPEEKIAILTAKAEKWPRLLNKVVHLGGGVKKMRAGGVK